jgi:hypothetical protein
MEFILAEIRSARRFVEARSRHDAKVDLTQILKSFGDKLTKLVNTHSLTSAEIAIIMQELEKSPYTDDHTASIIACLDDKMMQLIAADDKQPTAAGKLDDSSAGKSKMHYWWNYFTEADWLVFKDPAKSFYAKMEHACHKSRSIGCVDPDEQSIKWLLALLLKLHFGSELPTALQKYRKFNDFKSLFATEDSRKDMKVPPSLPVYPKDAAELPSYISEPCYEHGPPISMHDSPDIAGLANIAKLIPLRKNSALLKEVPSHEFEDAWAVAAGSRHRKSGSSSNILDSPRLDSPKLKLENVEPKPEAVGQNDPCKFCPSCGYSLRAVCSHDPAPVKEEPDNTSSIRGKLRLNGQPLPSEKLIDLPLPSPMIPLQPPKIEAPQLDEHALAAIAALETRKEQRKRQASSEAAANAKRAAAGAPAGGNEGAYDGDGDDDDNDAESDDDDDAEKVMKRPGMKTVMKKKTVMKRPACIMKKPGMKPTVGCLKCRGLSCVKCHNPDFKGRRVTREEWLTLGLK